MFRTETHTRTDAPGASPEVAGLPVIDRHGLPGGDWPGFEPSPPAFAAWLERQAEQYQALGSDRAVWLARRLEQLAREARILGADGPAAFDERFDAWDSGLRGDDGSPGQSAISAHHMLQPDVARRVLHRAEPPSLASHDIAAPDRHDETDF